MTGDLTDKEKIVHRLEGKEIKEYCIELSNTIKVIIDAISEEEAEKIINRKLESGDYSAYDEAVDEDGWVVELVEEA